MKRHTPLKKQSKQPISRLQRKLWQLCREISLKRYPSTCYTCNATNLQGFNRQLGHMWAKASLGAYLKYDLRILRWQCNTCNQFRGGMGADFYRKMLAEIGESAMFVLEKDRRKIVRAYEHYQNLIVEYTKILESLT